jgi:ribA/ribD-fused uncharacterized protein
MITHPKFRDHLLETSGEAAGFYERTFFGLSNFSSFAVKWPMPDSDYADWRPTTLWPTSEHAYQAARFMDTAPALSEAILVARSAHVARQIAMEHVHRQRPDWDEIKVGVMLSICRAKLSQHPYIATLLERTGNYQIVEDSPVDPFWGWGPNRDGRNALGKIWMQLREELRDGTIYPQ